MAQSREEQLEYKKQYRKNNPDKIKAQRKQYIKTHQGRALRLLASCRRRAKLSKSEMTLTKEWILERLEKGFCEITGMDFKYTRKKEHTRSAFAPSVDRINPRNPNYTPENCRVVLWAVNNTFAEYGEEIMLPILEAIVDAKKIATSSVPAKNHRKIKRELDDRLISRTRLGEDDDCTDHHCGTISREDLDHRTKASSGDSMGTRDQEVGTPKTSHRGKNTGVAYGKIVSYEELCEDILSELRKSGVVA